MFGNDFLASSNQMKLCTTNFLPIKQDDIYDYNPLCFMSSGLMIGDFIMNIFTDSTKKSTKTHQKHVSRIQDDNIHLYKGYMQDFKWKRKNADKNRTLCLHHFIELKI